MKNKKGYACPCTYCKADRKTVRVSDPSQPIKIVLMLATLGYIVWRVETIVRLLSDMRYN